MYYDLNVPVLRSLAERDRQTLLTKLFEYGYDCVALNHIVYGRLSKQHRCTLNPVELEPVQGICAVGKRCNPSLLRASEGGSRIEGSGKGKGASFSLMQMTRLTVVLESLNDLQQMTPGSDALLSYDVVAAQPCCQQTLEHLCQEGEADIICFPQAERLPFHVNKPLVDAALGRGVVFEISYSQAIQNSAACRFTIGNVQSLLSYSRGRGIILSSGAESALACRSPKDVANLGQFLGLTQEQSLRAVGETALAVLKRAEARRGRYRGVETVRHGGLDPALVVPAEFYLPEAMPVKGEHATLNVGGAEGDAINDSRGGEMEDDQGSGFISF
ncbi:unnamed protein product [Choristocarpus tenellus]